MVPLMVPLVSPVIKVRALVRGEAASSTSVQARFADNGPGIHMAKIAVGA